MRIFISFKNCLHILEKLDNDSSGSIVPKNIATGSVISARLKSSDVNSLRGPMASRRKPADCDPDVIFLNQQKQAPWCSVRYKKFSVSIFLL